MLSLQRCAREGVMYETRRLWSREASVPTPAAEALKQFAQQLYDNRFGPGAAAGLAAACDSTLKRAEEVAVLLGRGEVGGVENLGKAYLLVCTSQQQNR
jgi:hypothetical protein